MGIRFTYKEIVRFFCLEDLLKKELKKSNKIFYNLGMFFIIVIKLKNKEKEKDYRNFKIVYIVIIVIYI